MAFETHMKALRELTQKLEQGNLPLEEAVQLYSKGMELAASCQEELQTAKLQISKQNVPAAEQEETDGSRRIKPIWNSWRQRWKHSCSAMYR